MAIHFIQPPGLVPKLQLRVRTSSSLSPSGANGQTRPGVDPGHQLARRMLRRFVQRVRTRIASCLARMRPPTRETTTPVKRYTGSSGQQFRVESVLRRDPPQYVYLAT